MNTTHTAPTDRQQKITVESRLLYVMWTQGCAYAGFEAQFEMKTVLVGDGAKVKVTCYTEKGKKLDRLEGAMFRNRFIGKVLIPETVKPDDYIYLEVELPKHGLSRESNFIPVRPSIEVSSMKWSKKEIRREEEVRLSCVFTSGVEEGDAATVTIYEYDSDGHHDKVVTIPAVIKGNKVELDWQFIYQYDTDDIPTEAELNKYSRSYNPPEYFFTVTVDNISIGRKQESGLLLFNDFIEIDVCRGRAPCDEQQKYIITFADGSEVTRSSNSEGKILLDKATPGPFIICPEEQKDEKDPTVKGKTGTPLTAIYPDNTPLVDIHAHAQSNNCCPLPLQWAILAKSIAGLVYGRPANFDRKKLTGLLTGWATETFVSGRFGKVGRNSTDLIGKLYMEDLKDMDMKVDLAWTVLEKGIDENMSPQEQEKMRVIAGKKAELSKMSGISAASWQEKFIDAAKYYFKGTHLHRMCLVLSMDLSCTSYWSQCGLPLYLPTADGMLYIDDFVAAKILREGNDNRVKVILEDGVVTPRTYISSNVNRFIGNDDSVSKCDTLIHLHAAFFPGDKCAGDPAQFYLRQYDMRRSRGVPGEKEYPVIKFPPAYATTEDLLRKKYCHFISCAPGEDNTRFEDYAIQRGRTISILVCYPLSVFGGYHYDPRRHLLEKSLTVRQIAESIYIDHAFFTAQQENRSKFKLSNGVEYQGAIEAMPHPALNTIEGLEKILAGHLRSNDDAIRELFLYDENGTGLFWCIKIYPRLGYSPDDFTRFPNLEKLYRECADKKIPITAHCSPGGMSAADYYLYERYDGNAIKNDYDLDHAEKLFDGVLPESVSKSSPVQWRSVLEKINNLKLCLAHVGGYDTWKMVGSFEEAEKKLAQKSRDGKYDKYDYYRDWVKTIAEMAQKYDHVYTDISYFMNNVQAEEPQEGNEMVASNLVFLLKKYPGLKDRVMVGTDWYMIEKEGEKGLGDYMHRMFETLKLVSKETGYDAWHQFAVVNPLRYLGLIEEMKGIEGPFIVKTEVLERYGERVKGRLGSWKSVFKNENENNEILSDIESSINLFKKMKVVDSKAITKNNKLLILCE